MSKPRLWQRLSLCLLSILPIIVLAGCSHTTQGFEDSTESGVAAFFQSIGLHLGAGIVGTILGAFAGAIAAYHIGFPLGNETSIEEALLNGRSLDDLSILVNENTPNEIVVIVPRIAHGSIDGSLKLSGVGGRPGIVVQAVASSSTLLIPANEDGSFRLYGLPAGEYRLFGWNDVTTVPYNSQPFLERFVQHGVTMHLAEGEAVAHIEVEAFSSNL